MSERALSLPPAPVAAINPIYRRRLWVHRIGITLSFAAMAVGIFFLLWILGTLLYKGLGAVNIGMFTLNTATRR